MRDYKFTGTRYITKGIKEELSESLINYLWSLIDNFKNKSDLQMDYLQVFEIKTLNKNQRKTLSVTHIQEVPPTWTCIY